MSEVDIEDDSDYKDIEKFSILNEEQLKDYKKQRDIFTLKFKADDRQLSDFGECIVIERKVHRYVIDAQEKYGESISRLKMSLTNRIITLYHEALRFFENEYLLWIAYLNFCKSYHVKEVSSAYDHILKVYNNEKDWCEYAAWVYENKNDLNATDYIISRALKAHPESEKVCLTKFRILLAHISQMNQVEQTNGLKQIMEFYTKCKKKFKNYKLLLEFLESCETNSYCEFTAGLQKMILNDLKELFSHEERVLDSLAQRELRGFCESDIIQSANNISTDLNTITNKIWKTRSLKSRINLCCKAYEDFIKIVCTPEMLNMYINAMKKLNENPKVDKECSWRCLIHAYKTGHKMKLMNCEKYCELFEFIIQNEEMRKCKFPEEVFVEIPNTLLNLEKVVYTWLSFYLNTYNKEKNISKLLHIISQNLSPQKTLPIWEFVILQYQTRHLYDHRRIQNIYRDACSIEHLEYQKFRIQFLDWCMNHVSIEQTRIEYDNMVNLSPPYLELHQKMAKIEGNQLRININRWRLCHENAVSSFGYTQRDVWIDYIKFETDFGDSNHVAEIYNRMSQTIST